METLLADEWHVAGVVDQTLGLRSGAAVARVWDVISQLERRVMEYPEVMCETPSTVTDEMSAALLRKVGCAGAGEADRQNRRGEPRRPHQRRPRHPVAMAAVWNTVCWVQLPCGVCLSLSGT